MVLETDRQADGAETAITDRQTRPDRCHAEFPQPVRRVHRVADQGDGERRPGALLAPHGLRRIDAAEDRRAELRALPLARARRRKRIASQVA